MNLETYKKQQLPIAIKKLYSLLRGLRKNLRFTAKETKDMLLENPKIDKYIIARFLNARKNAEVQCKTVIEAAKVELNRIQNDVSNHYISIDDALNLVHMLEDVCDNLSEALNSISTITMNIKIYIDIRDIQEAIEFVEYYARQTNNALRDVLRIDKKHREL